MFFRLHKRLPGLRALFIGNGNVYAAKGYSVLAVDQRGRSVEVGRQNVPSAWRLLATWRLTRQAFRLGIHNVLPLADGSLVAVGKGVLLRKGPGASEFQVTHRLRCGNKPAFRGVCVDPQGRVFHGEYALNRERALPIALWRSDDGGCNYIKVFEFAAGRVRHIHFVQWDAFAGCLWMGTGDRDEECLLMRSFDAGEHWETVGGGSQLWRAVGLAFLPQAILWGTDAGSDAGRTPNHIVYLDRSGFQPKCVGELQGPCHGIATLRDGTVLLSTGVEGGVNEQDAWAHLWGSRDGEHWEELARFQKDIWPFRLQYGVIHFPHRLDQSDLAHFTTYGLKNGAETWHVGQLADVPAMGSGA